MLAEQSIILIIIMPRTITKMFILLMQVSSTGIVEKPYTLDVSQEGITLCHDMLYKLSSLVHSSSNLGSISTLNIVYAFFINY